MGERVHSDHEIRSYILLRIIGPSSQECLFKPLFWRRGLRSKTLEYPEAGSALPLCSIGERGMQHAVDVITGLHTALSGRTTTLTMNPPSPRQGTTQDLFALALGDQQLLGG
jgi:hypothetical protein